MNGFDDLRLVQYRSGLKAVENGRIIDRWESPKLDQLREFSRELGDPFERLDLLEANLNCSKCGEKIKDRFSATPAGDLLCWQCANQKDDNPEKERRDKKSTDPAKVVLGKSGLYHKSLCDYVINVATGCTHGCKFCYVPSTPNITARSDMLEKKIGVKDGQQEWGSYLLYRDDLPERLARKLDRKQKWKQTPRGRGVVMLSSGTDCYQDRRTAQITRGCVIELVKRGFPVRILTRSPAVVRDLDIYKKASDLTKSNEGNLVRVGSSIPCLDEEQVKAIEPNAPAPAARLRALRQLSDAGIPVYVSMSPTYPTQDRDDFEYLMKEFATLDPEVIFHEPINPRGANFDMTIKAAREAGGKAKELADELENIKDRDYWVEYSVKQMRWVEELGEEYNIDVHIWPDNQVIRATGGELHEKLKKKQEEVSPENIVDVPLPS